MKDIKLCLCGAKPILWADSYDPVDFGYLPTEYQIECLSCHRRTNWHINRDDAIKQWNNEVELYI